MIFYSPYQFIPAKSKVDGNDVSSVEFKQIRDGAACYARHDRWSLGSLSGRIVCRLTTKSPTLVGAEQTAGTDEAPACVENYRRGKQLAIPANSLRGMIASVGEAVSQSAMRVLVDEAYSVRKGMGESLKAIGMLKREDNGEFKIWPLALTAAPINEDGTINFGHKWQKVFDDMPLAWCLSAYVGDYRNKNHRAPTNELNQRLHDGELLCFPAPRRDPDYVYAKLDDNLEGASCVSMQCKVRHLDYPQAFHIKYNKRGRPTMLTGQKVSDVSNQQKEGDVRGALYTLGKKGREATMPNNKRHELFIPWPSHKADRLPKLAIELPPKVIEDFDEMARARNESEGDLPFLPVGYASSRPRSNFSRFLREDDLLYFDVNDRGDRVTEISFSSIWRRRIPGSTHQFFSKIDGGSPNLVPWGQTRAALTPAECLFGAAEERENPKPNPNEPQGAEPKPRSRNLASRLRFSDALPLGEIELLSEVPLKILASPKPPSPAMYFKTNNGGYVSKKELSVDEGHLPNGRKRYLHQQPEVLESLERDGKEPWRSLVDDPKTYKQKLRGWPIDRGQDFWFHIDFDNLSEQELELLRTAIAPADSAKADGSKTQFWHKLGLGKPLGLGSVDVQIEGIFVIDRQRRYTEEGLKGRRYHHYIRGQCAERLQDLGRLYPVEAEAAVSLTEGDIHRKSDYIDTQTLQSLLTLGDASQMQAEVCYPFSEPDCQAPYNESEGFKWFMQNSNEKTKITMHHYLAGSQVDPRPALTSAFQPTYPAQIRLKGISCANDRERHELAMLVREKFKGKVYRIDFHAVSASHNGSYEAVLTFLHSDAWRVIKAYGGSRGLKIGNCNLTVEWA